MRVGSSLSGRQAAITAWSRRLPRREPATSAATFCSSTTFQRMNSITSGWSRSRQTILAARRVVPPDLMAPAARSPILRKDISPEDLPPPERGSFSPRRLGEVRPRAGAVLEDARLARPEVHDPAFVDEIVLHGLDEAGAGLRPLVRRRRPREDARGRLDVEVALGGAGEAVGPVQARVEPLRRVGRGHLRREHVAELVVEGPGVGGPVEVTVALAPVRPRAGEPVKDLPGVPLAAQHGPALLVEERLAVGADLRHPGLAEVLLREDVGRDRGPRGGHRDAVLTEDRRAIRVLDLRGSEIEVDPVVGALAFGRVSAGDLHTALLGAVSSALPDRYLKHYGSNGNEAQDIVVSRTESTFI